MLSAEDKAEIPIAEFIEDVAAFCQARGAGPRLIRALHDRIEDHCVIDRTDDHGLMS
jgi:hypothetical protein